MLVYGDPQFQETLSAALDGLRVTAAACPSSSTDHLRALLIQLGQLEQAIHDCQECSLPMRQAACVITDFAAQAFYSRWRLGAPASAAELLCAIDQRLSTFRPEGDPLLTFKIPEGFEFYTLFPEQYCAAAENWARHHAEDPGEVLVVGIRSIGTTLSAVVQVALKRAGWHARRITVRPYGDPYDRRVDLGNLKNTCRHTIVVDEGPGMSGSSIAAVIAALHQTGSCHVSIFPGHNSEPGPAAPEHVRHLWSETPKYLIPLRDILWDGLTLPQQLTRITAELHQEPAESISLLDFSGGLWRPYVCPPEDGWPPVGALFERVKYWCHGTNHRAVLWKFAGLGSSYGPLHDRLLASTSRSSPMRLGFEPLSWVNGIPLSPQRTRDPQFVQQAAEYLASSAGPELSPDEQNAALGRLKDILYWNVQKTSGEAVASRILGRVASIPVRGGGPTYTDGRMAPHEWIETSGGKLVKVDTRGHLFDHTLIGPQNLLWDLVGLCVEWGLPKQSREAVLGHVQRVCTDVNLNELPFYEAAYLAFRLGFCALAAGQTVDPGERKRLQLASTHYQHQLLRAADS